MEENDIYSPDVSKKTPNTATSDSSPVQESPFFTFANNLSPLESVKAPRVSGHHFLGLNSPPMVFTSPRLHIRRGSNFLDRPHFSPLATVQSVDEVKVLGDGPADSEMLASLLPIFITPNKNYPDTQHCNSSPSPCVESVSKYFADPSDIDQESLVHSVDPDVKPCNENAGSSLNDLSHSEKAVSEFDGKHGPDDQMNRPLILLEDFECSYREKVDEAGNVGGEKAFELTSQECPKLETVLFADHVLQKQRSDDSTVPCTGNEMQDHCDLAYQSMLEPLLDVVECENDSEIGITSHVSLQNLSRESTKASQKHRGLPRRCLRFGEAASSAIGNLNSCPLQAHVPVDSIPSASSVESKDLETSHVALNDASGEERMIRQSKPVTPTFSPQCSGSFKGSKPSGIGLHLNSIVNAMPHEGAAFTGMKLADTGTDSHGGKSVTIVSCRNAEDLKKGSISSNMDEKISVGNKCERHERNAPISADSLPPGSPSSIEPTHLSIHVEHPAYVNDELKLISVGDGRFEGSNQTSPKKKKKKTSNSADDDGCKRCNCKKSRCLKLYCDCFAAGLYCTSESCSCQNCLNRPEYSDKVVETRQQIETRNPHAFAPKIVLHVTDSSSNNTDDTNVTTPSSARHKRGCNCKKSECLKKYCECYQANVGCSGGCRCEGCKNAYGKKEEFLAIEHALSEEKRNKAEEGSNSTLHEELETEARKKDLSHGELYDLLFLSPITPSLEYSDKGKQAANLQVPGKYIPATEARNASYEWQQASKQEMMDQSSTRCDSVAKVDHLAISNSQSMSNDSFSTKTKDQTHIMRILSGGSLRWRSSPITPMTKLGEIKSLQCLESDSKLPDILEDETPEVLKEASTPTKSVKTSSPKQKRVSPPHSHLRGLGSSSSGGLRIGRKFILKAVPSFPPLTPCITSKANNDHETSENCKQVTDVPNAEKKTTQ